MYCLSYYLGIISLCVLCTTVAHAEQSDDRTLIQERIKPIGIVNIQGANTDTPQTVAVKPNTAKPMSGLDTYQKYCITCHASGVAGAPKAHHQEDWAPRLKKGIDGLLKSALVGLNAMPAKGTCNECTDQQLKAAIEYMTAKSS